MQPDSFESGILSASSTYGKSKILANEREPELKYFWVTMKLEANYKLLVPAISEDEAIIEADDMEIPFLEISGVEKDVIQVAEMKPI